MKPTLRELLERKPLYYDEIDLHRIDRAYERIGNRIEHPRIVHVVGTNGKGSTGRMIAHLAYRGGLRVGHYSSPHILRFNERIWIDGASASDESLEQAHGELYAMLGKELSDALSYFEYTTLLALVFFQKCDLIVLEAGLGGEHDATRVAPRRLVTVVTPIGLDHQAFLGDEIEEIAGSKLRSIEPGARIVLAPQPYEEIVLPLARRIASQEACTLDYLPAERTAELPESPEIEHIAREKGWPAFLRQNAAVASRALQALEIPYRIDDLRSLELFGRFYPLAPNLRIDVGHNPLAARALVRAMHPRSVLIYNVLSDKDAREVLRIMAPRLKRVELIPIRSRRAADLGEIEALLDELEIPWAYFDGTLFSHEYYLVFGSYYTVEAFLERIGWRGTL